MTAVDPVAIEVAATAINTGLHVGPGTNVDRDHADSAAHAAYMDRQQRQGWPWSRSIHQRGTTKVHP